MRTVKRIVSAVSHGGSKRGSLNRHLSAMSTFFFTERSRQDISLVAIIFPYETWTWTANRIHSEMLKDDPSDISQRSKRFIKMDTKAGK